jgi:dienelactone hydrolase
VGRRDVEFRTEDGTTLRGYFHAPAGGSGPAVVMAHGFSGVKEQIDHYAEFFAAAGFAVLVYDHRGFGTSDGTPRLEWIPSVS